MSRCYHRPLHDYQFVEEVLENVNRCAALARPFYVNSRRYFQQCSRPRGHGPGGIYCKQHAQSGG